MSKDLHDMDDIFNSAYRQFEDEPSSDVWGKINAGLDKRDAASYKKRSTNWKRIAVLALLLLLGFIVYEAGILIKTGAGHSKANTPGVAVTKKPGETVVATEKSEMVTPDHHLTVDKGYDVSTSMSKENPGKNKNNNGIVVMHNENIFNNETVKTEDPKASLFKERIGPTSGNDPMELTVSSFTAGKKIKEVLKNRENLLKKKITISLLEKNYSSEMAASLLTGIPQVHLDVKADSRLMNNTGKNKKQKGGHQFQPFWTITAFASNEWANYRLENDLQTAAKIKQREVHEPSFSGGALIARQFNPRWSLQTGLIYSHTSIGISPQKIYAFNDPAGSVAYKYVTSSGYGYVKPDFGSPPAVGDSLTATEAKHTLKHISIPLMIKYRIGKNKLSVLPGAGIAINFQTGAKIETEVENASGREIVSINKLNGTRSSYLSFTADAELQYKLSNKASVSFRPAFRYALSPITKNNAVETYPYSFGAGLGLTIRL